MHLPKVAFAIVAAAATAFLSACGGGPQHDVLPMQSAHGAGAQQVTFKIDAPKNASSTQKSSPLYLSPATTKLAIDVQTGCPASCVSYAGYPVTQALTPTSTGCTTTLATTQCQLTLALPPNTYSATLTAEDTGGTALSTAQSIAFTVAAGANNVIPIVLSGVPTAIIATTLNATSHAVLVNALDADNNIIAGVGAPTFTVSDTAGIAVTLAQPTAASPNIFTVTPSVAGTATLHVAASYSGTGVTDACTQSGAVCSADFSLAATIPLFVVNGGNNTVTEYALPNVTTPTTMSTSTSGVNAVAVDSAGNLFVASAGANTVTEYAPPYTGTPVTISTGVSAPGALAFDSAGNLFVANTGNDTVTEYAPPYTASPVATIAAGLGNPDAMAFDASGNLFVANYGQGTVAEFAPPFTGGSAPSALIYGGLTSPTALAFGTDGTLFVADQYGTPLYTGSALAFTPPFTSTSTPTTTISNSVGNPSALALDPSGDLFVLNHSSSTVTVYAPPYTGAPTATVSADGYGLALDPGGNLFVPNESANTVSQYASPFTGAAAATVSNGVNSPVYVTLAHNFNISISPVL